MSDQPTTIEQTDAREIKNVAMLDLSTMKSAEELDKISSIKNVATILIAESLHSKLMTKPIKNVASIIPIPDGENVRVKVINGPVQLGGDAFSAESDLLNVYVVNGPLIFTTPVHNVHNTQLVVNGPILAPEGSESALGMAIRDLNGPTVYFPAGGQVRSQTGQVRLDGDVLANGSGNESDVFLVVGQTFITTPVAKVGYRQVVVAGQLFAPRESQGLLSNYLNVAGQVVWYTGVPRFVNGNDSFAAAFFEYLREPVSLIINGVVTIEPDVTVELLRAKVTEIVLNGILEGPKELVPLLQVLTVEKNGMINVAGEDDEDEG
ncbi:MAG: hypothetical protein R3A44_24960 [Caldilineaceae bacterium]